MSASLTITQTQLFTAVVSVMATFDLAAPDGAPVPIVRGQVNRVPEPKVKDFVVLWPINRNRLTMNVHTWADTAVAGSIADNVLTVTDVTNGPIVLNAILYNADIASGCRITRQISGDVGGTGTYAVTTTPDLAATTIYCGQLAAMQETEVTLQADVHGPAGADNAARISTLWRDQYGVSAFLDQPYGIAPLYTSEPRQIPFQNGEQQWEERWTVDLTMQANVSISTTQQFADALVVTPEPVDAFYP